MRSNTGKVRLDLDAIRVDSFEILPERLTEGGGTVRGYESDGCCPSENPSCINTNCFPDSCDPPLCGTFDTCAASCASVIMTC